MAIQLSTAARDDRLDAFETTVGATAKLQIRTGAQPANCAAASTGTLLVEMTLPADYLAAASGGTKSKSGTWQGTAVATGTAAHFRIFDNAGTTCHMQGGVALTGSDMDIDNTSIATSQTVTVSTFDLNDVNS